MRRSPGPDLTADRLRAAVGPLGVTVGEVRAMGITPAALRAAVRAGTVERIARGLVRVAGPAPPDHGELVRAALRRSDAAAVVSHASAAVLLGLPLPGAAPDRVHLNAPGRPEFSHDLVRMHGSPLPADQCTVVDGMPVTDVRRTAVDLARHQPMDRALVPMDAAARRLVLGDRPMAATTARHRVRDAARRRAAREELLAVVESMAGWPGIVGARRAAQVCDPAAESPFESRSRGWMLATSLPVPACGVQVEGASGAAYWVDFWWEQQRVAGEADGLAKYGGGDQAVIRAERIRQSDLEAAGVRVVRWTTGEPPWEVIARLDVVLRPPRATRHLRSGRD